MAAVPGLLFVCGVCVASGPGVVLLNDCYLLTCCSDFKAHSSSRKQPTMNDAGNTRSWLRSTETSCRQPRSTARSSSRSSSSTSRTSPSVRRTSGGSREGRSSSGVGSSSRSVAAHVSPVTHCPRFVQSVRKSYAPGVHLPMHQACAPACGLYPIKRLALGALHVYCATSSRLWMVLCAGGPRFAGG